MIRHNDPGAPGLSGSIQGRIDVGFLDPPDDIFPGQEILRTRDDNIGAHVDNKVALLEGNALLYQITHSFCPNENRSF